MKKGFQFLKGILGFHKKSSFFCTAAFCFSFVFCFASVSCAKKNGNEVMNQGTKFPQKIVALSPAATEILFALGAGEQVAAVSEFSDYPPEALQKDVVGGFDGKTLSMEKILSFRPDFIYLNDGMHNFLIDQIKSYDIDFYLSKANSISSVEQEIIDVGKLTGHEQKAEELVSQISAKIDSVVQIAPKPSVYYEVWNSPYITSGGSSFIGDIISKSGGKNIFDDIRDAYPIVSEESIIARQPEFIFIPMSSGISVEMVKSRKGWESIPAVKNNKIFIIDDNLYTRPGPRIGDVVLQMNTFLQ